MRQLFSLYGPLGIQSFGLFIVIGIILFTYLFLRDPRRKKLISSEQYYNLLSSAIVMGFIGGRLLYITTSGDYKPFWHIFALWEGGYSLLGGILALLIIIPWNLNKMNIPILPLLDVISIYAPLLQSVSRIGCFFAGCCYGLPTTASWGIITSGCSIKLHPTQLYSAALSFFIFIFLYLFGQKLFKKRGQLICAYLILISIERFTIDFWRGDKEFIFLSELLSVSQIIALALGLVGILGFSYFTFESKRKK